MVTWHSLQHKNSSMSLSLCLKDTLQELFIYPILLLFTSNILIIKEENLKSLFTLKPIWSESQLILLNFLFLLIYSFIQSKLSSSLLNVNVFRISGLLYFVLFCKKYLFRFKVSSLLYSQLIASHCFVYNLKSFISSSNIF